MFGTSGIRGPVGETVTATLGVKLGRSVAGWGADRVVVGRDARPSGHALTDAVAAGLREGGAAVVDLGMAATPTIARAVDWCDAEAGIAVTASHNPPTDNGFKCWLPSGKAFGPDERAAIEHGIETYPKGVDPTDEPPRTRWEGAQARHVEAIRGAVAIEDPLSVVVDVGNGVGQVTARALDELGCSVTTLNGQPDGRFPGRPSEPTAANCSALRAHVPAVGADLGIAHDGDADRLQAVTEDGDWVSGDALLAIFARATAARGDRVAVPVDTSLAVRDALEEVGVALERTPVGDVYVAERASDAGVAFGGEPSGCWIWPASTLCPDAPLAAARLTALVSKEGPLSRLAARIPSYPIRRSTVRTTDKPAVMERVTARIQAEATDVETLDGLRVDTGDGWYLIRPSGTEPLIRVTAEAREADRADGLLKQAESVVLEAVDAVE